ncbi:MAG: methyltransferase [Proteobacteria bacterium]|nr:methyltransferase [Pseudomonadota bacterium]
MYIADDETLDILCDDEIKIIQKKDGYRFSIDAILLSNFITLKKHERLLDIGTGCGIIPVYMSKKGNKNFMTGIEIQEELFHAAQKNKDLNNCENIQFIHGDIKLFVESLKKTPFHVIVSNPPYTKEHTGRKSPKHSRFIARYESYIDLSILLSASAALLNKKGRFYIIYPSKRLGELIYTAKANKLEPKRLRLIYPKKEKSANLFLAEFTKEGGMEVTIEKPLYIYDNEQYTEEIESYYCLKG